VAVTVQYVCAAVAVKCRYFVQVLLSKCVAVPMQYVCVAVAEECRYVGGLGC